MRKPHQDDRAPEKRRWEIEGYSPKANSQERCHCGKNVILDTEVLPIVGKQGFCDIIRSEWPENHSGSGTRGLQSY